LTLNEVRDVKTALDREDVKVSAIGSPIGKIGITDDFEPHFEKFKEIIETAKILDTKYIRIFSFYIPEGEKPEDYRDEVMRRMKAFADEAEKQGFVDRFFDNYAQDKRSNPEDGIAFRQSMKAFSDASNNPEQMKELMENAIKRMGNYIQNQPAKFSTTQIVMGAFVRRIMNVCEHKKIPISNEAKNLADGISLLGRVAKESMKIEKLLLTNKVEAKSYEDVLKRYATTKMLENRFLKGEGKTVDNISAMGVAIYNLDGLDMIANLVGETKGFKNLMACSPKNRAYIISSSNEMTAKLYEGINKECIEIRNEIKREAEKMNTKEPVKENEGPIVPQ
jgi:hypothetical protein